MGLFLPDEVPQQNAVLSPQLRSLDGLAGPAFLRQLIQGATDRMLLLLLFHLKTW